MALEIRPNCEYCDKDLPNGAPDARICTYECTYCADCVDNILENVCPNCGGAFTVRPKRPETAWRDGVSTKHQPPGTKRRHLKYSKEYLAAHTQKIKSIPPENR